MAKSTDLSEQLAKIKKVLGESEGQYRTGAVLHRIINEAAPGLDIREVVGIPTGPGALTKFIEDYLGPYVKQIGHQGGDKLYGIGEGVEAPPEVDDPNVWKAFVSPSTTNYLFVDVVDGSLVTSKEPIIDERHKQIHRVSQEEHNEIRAGFVATLSAGVREELGSSIDESSSYDDFITSLRDAGRANAWGRFRKNAFRDLLLQRLASIGLDEGRWAAVAHQLMASQNALFRREERQGKVESGSNAGAQGAHLGFQPSKPMVGKRLLLQKILSNMSSEDLRAIRVPFGAVLDAIEGRE